MAERKNIYDNPVFAIDGGYIDPFDHPEAYPDHDGLEEPNTCDVYCRECGEVSAMDLEDGDPRCPHCDGVDLELNEEHPRMSQEDYEREVSRLRREQDY